jgi:DNA-binding XRE family transcriptional regulator
LRLFAYTYLFIRAFSCAKENHIEKRSTSGGIRSEMQQRGFRISNLRDIRERNGLSQQQLAAHAEVSVRTINAIESKNVIVRGLTLHRILNALRKLDSNAPNDLSVKQFNER